MDSRLVLPREAGEEGAWTGSLGLIEAFQLAATPVPNLKGFLLSLLYSFIHSFIHHSFTQQLWIKRDYMTILSTGHEIGTKWTNVHVWERDRQDHHEGARFFPRLICPVG